MLEAVQMLREKFHFKKEFTFNIDETRANSLHTSAYSSIVSITHFRRSNLIPRDSDLTTIVPIVSADGKCWLVVYIFKKDVSEPKLENAKMDIPSRSTRSSWPIRYAYTRSGHMNGVLWNLIAKAFIAIVKPVIKDQPAILFLDSLSSHTQEGTLQLFLQQGIHVVLFPSHTTPLLQPLDNVAFASLKSWMKIFEHRRLKSLMPVDTLPSTFINDIMEEATKAAFTKRVIEAAFRNTGIEPWDPNAILNRLLPVGHNIKNSVFQFFRQPTIESTCEQTKEHVPPIVGETNRRKIVAEEKNEMFTADEILNLKTQENETLANTRAQVAAQEKEFFEKGGEEILRRKEGKKRRREEELEKKRQHIVEKSARKLARKALHCNFCEKKFKYDRHFLYCSTCKLFCICRWHIGDHKREWKAHLRQCTEKRAKEE